MDPIFLTEEIVLEFHALALERFGGPSGVRDSGLLASALSMPSQQFGGEYLHGSISGMAAAYAYHIVRNHPFVDGNKRTGAIAAITFLHLNGYRCNASNQELEEAILAVAAGSLAKEELVGFFRQHLRSNA